MTGERPHFSWPATAKKSLLTKDKQPIKEEIMERTEDRTVKVTLTLSSSLGLSKDDLRKEVINALRGLSLFELPDGREVDVDNVV